MKLTTHVQLVPSFRKCGAIHPFLPYIFMTVVNSLSTGTTLYLYIMPQDVSSDCFVVVGCFFSDAQVLWSFCTKKETGTLFVMILVAKQTNEPCMMVMLDWKQEVSLVSKKWNWDLAVGVGKWIYLTSRTGIYSILQLTQKWLLELVKFVFLRLMWWSWLMMVGLFLSLGNYGQLWVTWKAYRSAFWW